jgi:hypothetical protein
LQMITYSRTLVQYPFTESHFKPIRFGEKTVTNSTATAVMCTGFSFGDVFFVFKDVGLFLFLPKSIRFYNSYQHDLIIQFNGHFKDTINSFQRKINIRID